jgi:hypothetical protein
MKLAMVPDADLASMRRLNRLHLEPATRRRVCENEGQ